MQRERREHGGQGSGAHALHTVIWSVARGNHNSCRTVRKDPVCNCECLTLV